MLSLIILLKDIKLKKKRESYSNTLIVTVEVSFQLRTPRDDAQGTIKTNTDKKKSSVFISRNKRRRQKY